LLMQWDGRALQVQRHPLLTREVDTDRMLRDLCLVFWPASAIRDALPPGWDWIAREAGFALMQGDSMRLAVLRPSEEVVEIFNPTEGYRLVIESQTLEPT
jgi:hypothetical protein